MGLLQYSPKIHKAARLILADLMVEKASKSLSIIVGLKWSNLAIASLVNTKTSAAEASSFTESDKNSISNGITFGATSGNLIQQECKVRTKSCLYFPVSDSSTRLPAPVPEVLLIS